MISIDAIRIMISKDIMRSECDGWWGVTVKELIHELSFYDDECEVDLVVELDAQFEDELGQVLFSVIEKRVKLVNKNFDRIGTQ